MYQVMLLEMRSEEVLENMKSSNGSNFNIASEFVKGVRMGNDWHLTFLRASICDPSSCQEAVIHQVSLSHLISTYTHVPYPAWESIVCYIYGSMRRSVWSVDYL
jgi:hypothetical protein